MAEWVYWMPLLAIPIVLLFRFVGCDSFDAAEEEDFSMALAPTEVNVTQGASAQVSVSVSSSGTFAGNVTLSMAQVAGLTAGFSPNPVVLVASGKGESAMTVTAELGATPGTSTVMVQGAGQGKSGPLSASQSLKIQVNARPAAPTPDFQLSLTPTSRTVTAGAIATYIVNITRVGGFNEAVTLSVIPAGGTFTPNPATGATSTLSADTDGATAGTYAFTVTGTAAGGATRAANGTIVIT